MGSLLSVQSKEKRRRSNRLSKPPSNKATLAAINPILSHPASASSTPESSNPVDWQNPWTGASFSISSPDAESNTRRSESFPSVSHPDGLWHPSHGIGRSQSIAKGKAELCTRSPTSSSNTSGSLSRTASFQPSKQTAFQPTTLRSEPSSPLARAGQPKRSYSVHSPPHRTSNTLYTSGIEHATSSNTHFMVDSQGFSLIRRRSLLTRPGVATRRSTKDVTRRLPPPINQETTFANDPMRQSSTVLWPEPNDVEAGFEHPLPLPQFRPPTPNDFEYTHLGALKLGSLRVVNCSTSPCPSDRTHINHGRSPSPVSKERGTDTLEPRCLRGTFQSLAGNIATPGSSESIEPIHLKTYEDLNLMGVEPDPMNGRSQYSNGLSCRDSSNTLCNRPELPSSSHGLLFPDIKNQKDFSPCNRPGPTMVAHNNLLRGLEDEGISLSYEENAGTSQPTDSVKGDLRYWRSFRSHKKVDSGYSSAASVRSLQDARAKVPLDSQASMKRSAGFRRFTLGSDTTDLGRLYLKNCPELDSQLPVLRHLSLQDPDSAFRPELDAWPTNFSTMCHEAAQIPLNGRTRSSSWTSPLGFSGSASKPRYCAQLRSLESTPPSLLLQPPDIFPLKVTESASYDDPPFTITSRYNPSTGFLSAHNSNAVTNIGADKCVSSFTHSQTHTLKPTGMRKQQSTSGAECTTVGSESVVRTHSLGARHHKSLTASSLQSLEHTASKHFDSGSKSFVEFPRGRARSRGLENQRRRLAKPQGRQDIYTTTSPFVFH